MSKETLQHTMRSKVRVFEDGGIRLLRKGQKGLIHAIFSRFGLVLVLLVLQFGALFSLMRWFSGLLPHYLGGTLLVTAVMMVYLLNQDMNNSVRIPWLVVTALAPVLGVLLFWYTKEDVGHRMLKKRLLELEGQTRSQLPQNKKTGKALDADCPGAASLAQYLRGRGGGFPVYENTQVTYFPSGEAKFAALLPQLESATQYIFLEYFIIDEGLMWGRILEILAVRQLNTDVKGQIICLVGPPGVGKTSIARSVAACMDRNFARMSLGGVHDEAEIRGHRRTYIGAMPGRIISAINTAKSSNPVILLDEIDKLAGDYRGDPSSALLEVLDPEQNKTFKDNYLDIPFDLSNVLFITTANDASHIPGPLYDRMDVIELPSYTRVEKFNIARRHLLPKQLKNNGLESRVTMAPAALYEIIDGYTREAGVRTLERTITAVLRKCAQKIAAGEKDKINVTPAMVKAMLGPEKVKPTFISRTDAVGIANGLAWTSVGGEMLPIEVSIIPNGSGKVEITGSLGDVMKESAHLALTYARVHAETYHIAPDKFKNTDIHIHAPEGAVPKDGPSAGVTLTTALISALSEIPVRHDLAMTGEITLHGNVLPIGGLKEKSMAAFREGISTVLIPEANKPDLYEVDEEVKKAVKFIPVSDLSQVLKHALILPAASAAHKRTMPQATQLIATEQSTAKEPAAVM